MKKKTCKTCGGEYGFLTGLGGNCDACNLKAVAEKKEAQAMGVTVDELRKEAEVLDAFMLTTETAHNLPVTERLGIVTAESVLGMNVFKDIMADIRGIAGGRSKTLQKGLRDAREICLTELKRDAIKLGADAVVGIDLDYQDIGNTGKMLMVVASGTAVKLQLA